MQHTLLNYYLRPFHVWRIKHLSNRSFMIILSVFIGLVSGLAAVLLKNLAGFVEAKVSNIIAAESVNYWYLAMPFIGIMLTIVVVKVLIKEDVGHGVSKVLWAMSKGRGNISSKKAISSMLGSALTVGFGGSVGLEAPVVLTGAALGSKLGRIFKVDYSSLMLLIGCGATGAIAGIFNAPITGIIFTLEVLLLDLSMASIVMLLLSSVSAAIVSSLLLGNSLVFSFDVSFGYQAMNLPFYIALGILAGFISVYFVKLNFLIEKILSKWKNIWVKAAVASLVLGVMIYFFPPLFGEGFHSLRKIMDGDISEITQNTFFFGLSNVPIILLGLMLLLVFLKVISMSLTTGSGGVGGVFAPSLFVGGFLGAFMAMSMNLIFNINLPILNFALAGMAAVMSGVMHAPLTAIFLIAEITGGYKLFVPLIIAATIAYLLNRIFMPHSIYASALAEKQELLTHNKDKSILSMMKIENMIEQDFASLPENGKLRDVIEAISKSHRNIFPVIDENNNFVGVILLNNIRQMIFQPDLYDQIAVVDILTTVSDDQSISLQDTMETAIDKFKIKDHYTLVVLDDGKYVGFVSRSNVLNDYRNKVSELAME